MHARVATYAYSGDAQNLARQAEDGLLPIFETRPGFRAYTLIDTGDKLISVSGWDSAEGAEEANIAAAEWVEANIGDRVELQRTQVGEILVSTTLGVSTRAGMRA
jgi:hypothetical protein